MIDSKEHPLVWYLMDEELPGASPLRCPSLGTLTLRWGLQVPQGVG